MNRLPPRSRLRLTHVSAIVVWSAASGCHHPGSSAPGPSPHLSQSPEVSGPITSDTPESSPVQSPSGDVTRERRFARAVLFKPRESIEGTPPDPMAPLIMSELLPGEDGPDQAAWFGARSGIPGQGDETPAPPTIFTAKTRALIHGRCLDVLSYTWWYHTGQRVSEGTGLDARGIRLVLGEDGFPLICEVASGTTRSGRKLRIIYISQSLEDRASQTVGAPLPGRRFSVEPSIEEAPHVVVAGVFEDGPMPLGPYLYMEAGSRNIVELLCRCSPAQVEQVVATEVYDLKPASGTPSSAASPECKQDAVSRSLEQSLRWPP